MPAPWDTGNLSAYTVGGVDLLALIRDVEYRVINDTVDGKPLTRSGRSAQLVKRSMEMRASVMSNVSAPTRVANLDVTALTIDGATYTATIRSGSFNIEIERVEASSVNDLWKWPHVVARDITASFDLLIPSGSPTINPARLIGADAHSGTVSNSEMVLSLTVNGTAFTLPMLIRSISHKLSDGQIQMYSVELVGRSPDSGSYPTAPTGSTTLLEKALNAPGTAIAFTLTPKAGAGEGVSYGGNMIYTAASFSFQDGALVMTEYSFASQGAVTQTNA